jgi:hypothetical protein
MRCATARTQRGSDRVKRSDSLSAPAISRQPTDSNHNHGPLTRVFRVFGCEGVGS